jgi:hypothetical protein
MFLIICPEHDTMKNTNRWAHKTRLHCTSFNFLARTYMMTNFPSHVHDLLSDLMKDKEDMINLTSLNKHVKGINYTNGPQANHSYKSTIS